MANLVDRCFLFGALIMISAGVLSSSALAASNAANQSAADLLNRFSISDVNQIYQSCGDADSGAATCALVANDVIKTRFKDVKPMTSADINLIWDHCYDKGDDRLCARNINAILKSHMPSEVHYAVSEDDIRQVKNLSLAKSDDGYSSLLKQVDDFLS